MEGLEWGGKFWRERGREKAKRKPGQGLSQTIVECKYIIRKESKRRHPHTVYCRCSYEWILRSNHLSDKIQNRWISIQESDKANGYHGNSSVGLQDNCTSLVCLVLDMYVLSSCYSTSLNAMIVGKVYYNQPLQDHLPRNCILNQYKRNLSKAVLYFWLSLLPHKL